MRDRVAFGTRMQRSIIKSIMQFYFYTWNSITVCINSDRKWMAPKTKTMHFTFLSYLHIEKEYIGIYIITYTLQPSEKLFILTDMHYKSNANINQSIFVHNCFCCSCLKVYVCVTIEWNTKTNDLFSKSLSVCQWQFEACWRSYSRSSSYWSERVTR